MANIEFFNNSQGVQAEKIKFVTNVLSPAGVGPLEKLEGRIAAGAIHDSAERCHAPKCHPETRVAVQDDLYGWIVEGDGASEHPKKVKWVTGPAGTGKTAVVGSLSERCKTSGVFVATFFFASWSTSIGRRRKTALVTTIAHQLARSHPDLREEISKAIEANSDIFDKNLHTQMEVLVLGPLQEIACRPDGPGLQGAIIVDGLDECEAEQYHDITTTTSKSNTPPPRRNDEDQEEILRVLQAASLDPSFPFRIIIASRPERVFREFFDPENNPTPLVDKLDLHEQYNADADITLFLEAKLGRIRRRYNLPPSWLPPDAITTLVKRASGQFIYAATVIRFLEMGHREPPKALLQAILEMKATTTSNPLEQLDALYLHILNSSPNPPLSVRWIHGIMKLSGYSFSPSASNTNLLLETDPESNEADYFLGNLHSLIQIPPPSDQATAIYDFYHKTLFDFLQDCGRCGELYVEEREIDLFVWDGFVRACARGCGTRFQYPEDFLEFLVLFPCGLALARCSAYSEVLPTPASVDWWVSLAIASKVDRPLGEMFRDVHHLCPSDCCEPACRIWTRSILDRLGSSDVLLQDRKGISQGQFLRLVNKAINEAKRERVNRLAKEVGDTSTATESSTASSSKPKKKRHSKSQNRPRR